MPEEHAECLPTLMSPRRFTSLFAAIPASFTLAARRRKTYPRTYFHGVPTASMPPLICCAVGLSTAFVNAELNNAMHALYCRHYGKYLWPHSIRLIAHAHFSGADMASA